MCSPCANVGNLKTGKMGPHRVGSLQEADIKGTLIPALKGGGASSCVAPKLCRLSEPHAVSAYPQSVKCMPTYPAFKKKKLVAPKNHDSLSRAPHSGAGPGKTPTGYLE